MKNLVVVAMLALSTTAWAQKYYYNGGHFERDGENWAEFVGQNVEAPADFYQQIGVQEDYFIISNGTKEIAVPKAMDHSFLIKDQETGDWKYLSRSVDPNAPKPQKKPRLSPELKEMVVKNFRASTPYDGIHLYTSPFGYINTPHLEVDQANAILASSDAFSVEKQQDGTLRVERKDNIGYEDFATVGNTVISGDFENGRIRKCTYVFSLKDRKSAAAAKAHLVKHMGIASSGRDGQRYKVAWLKEISYFDMRTEDGADGSKFIVEVEYK